MIVIEAFNINNLAFEIREYYELGELTDEFISAWQNEWNRIAHFEYDDVHDVKGTTILGDTFEYKKNKYIRINGKTLWTTNAWAINRNEYDEQ